MEAIRIYTRYDLPDDKGQTRRERNEKFGFDKSPEVNIPCEGMYLWQLYSELSNAIHRIDFNGYYYNLPPSEILAWCKLANKDITSFEYDVISSMDNAFCKEINEDKNARDNRKFDEQKKELEKNAKRRR